MIKQLFFSYYLTTSYYLFFKKLLQNWFCYHTNLANKNRSIAV